MSIGHRAAITFVIVLAILFALALFGYLSGRWDNADAQQPPPLMYEGIALDASLLALDKRALDEAYHQQLVKLFAVWLSRGAPEDAREFINGLRNTRRAYNLAATAISKREQQLRELDQQQQQDRR